MGFLRLFFVLSLVVLVSAERIVDPCVRAKVMLAVIKPNNDIHPLIDDTIIKWTNEGYSLISIADTALGDSDHLVKVENADAEKKELIKRIKNEVDACMDQ